MHRPRGAFCHDGWCQQCRVTLPDGRVVLACEERAEALPMRSGAGWKRLLGRLAEGQPPWFYERRFLRPKALRQVFLNALRHLSGAKELPADPPQSGSAWRRRTCDVLVVGGGVAGLAAADEIARAGRTVIVVDARPKHRHDMPHSGGRSPSHEGAVEFRCHALSETLCVGLYEEPRRALCVDPVGSLVIEHGELVISTGAYDRMLTFTNNDLPGIVGVRALEILLGQRAVPSSTRIGVYGEPAEINRAMQALRLAGHPPHWIASPGFLAADPDGIPTHGQATLLAAQGKARIEAVELWGVGRLACDLMVLGFSQPGYELQLQRGARLRAEGVPRKLIPDVSGTGLLVVGEAAGDVDPTTVADDAARRARHWLQTGESPSPASNGPTHAMSCGAHPDAFICLCEDVRVRDIRQAIADGYGDIELIKRHTGAATGPCQGKLCHANLMDCLAEQRIDVRLPTQRPLVRPVTFARFAGAPEE
jgi:sarcosine oxidase subunit alpha